MPVVQLDLDSSHAVKGLKDYDKAVDRSAKVTETSFSKMREGANKYGAVIAAALATATAALVAFSLKSVTMASSVVEAQGVFDQAFAGMTATAEKWATELGNAYHLSGLKAKESLNAFQLVLRGMGVATEQAGKMSFALVKIAADLGAAFDRDTVDVVNDIRSALAGSTEVMSKYGIVVKQAQIVDEALRLGLIQTKGEINETARAQALFSLIMKKSGPIIGTTAREAKGYAGQLKEAQKNVGDLTAAIGEKLLPIFTQVLTKFNEWISAEGRANTIINTSIEVIRFLTNAYLGLEIALKSMIVVVGVFAQGLVKLLTPLAALLDALKYFNIIDTNPIRNLQLAVDDFVASAVEGVSNTVDKIEAMNKAFDDSKVKIDEVKEVIEDIGDVAKPSLGKVEEEMVKGVKAVKELQTDTKQLVVDIDAVSDSVAATGRAFSAAAVKGKEFTSSAVSYNEDGSFSSLAKDMGGYTGNRTLSMGSSIALTPAEQQYMNGMTAQGAGTLNSGINSSFVTRSDRDKWASQDALALSSREAAYQDILAARENNGGQPVTNITNIFNQQISNSDIEQITQQQTTSEYRA